MSKTWDWLIPIFEASQAREPKWFAMTIEGSTILFISEVARLNSLKKYFEREYHCQSDIISILDNVNMKIRMLYLLKDVKRTTTLFYSSMSSIIFFRSAIPPFFMTIFLSLYCQSSKIVALCFCSSDAKVVYWRFEILNRFHVRQTFSMVLNCELI